MTRDDIIRMAEEAGAKFDPHWGTAYNVGTATFERFAALVAAAERERIQDLIQRAEEAFAASEQAEKSNEEYERGFVDGMQEQMKTSVDRAVNAIDRAVNATCKREWVGLTDDEWKQIWIEFDILDVENDFQDYMAGKYGAGHYIDNELYWNFQKGVIEQIVNNKLQRKDGTYKDDK
ncbi:hypothetical protein EBT25_15435 [bacterium]|jgi:hypothetical protein|nr:hypothetical protein [bacterium]